MTTGYINMTPPKFDLVVEDCNTALSFDKKYLKALNRRAMALEALEKWEEALRGELVFPFCTTGAPQLLAEATTASLRGF